MELFWIGERGWCLPEKRFKNRTNKANGVLDSVTDCFPATILPGSCRLAQNGMPVDTSHAQGKIKHSFGYKLFEHSNWEYLGRMSINEEAKSLELTFSRSSLILKLSMKEC